MRNLSVGSFCLLLLCCALNTAHCQLASWNLNANGYATIADSTVIAGVFSGSANISALRFASTGVTAKTWSRSNMDSTKFFQLTMAPRFGYTLQINRLQFSERRSSTGIHEFELRWSTDSLFRTYTIILHDTVPDNTKERLWTVDTLHIRASTTEKIYFRWYGFRSETNAGSWRFNDKILAIYGSTEKLDLNLFDSKILPPQSQPIGKDISSLCIDSIQAVEVFRFRISDQGSGDALPTKVSRVVIKASEQNSADWKSCIAGIKLCRENKVICAAASIQKNYVEFNITEDSLNITDGGISELSLLIWFQKGGLNDGEKLGFKIDSLEHGCTNSSTSSGISPILPATIVSQVFNVAVTADRLMFKSVPQKAVLGKCFSITLAATDSLGNIDTSALYTASVSKAEGNGNLENNENYAKQSSKGCIYWSCLLYDVEDIFTIKTTSTSFDAAESPVIEGVYSYYYVKDDFEDGDLNDWDNIEDWENSATQPINGSFSLKHLTEGTYASRDTSTIVLGLPEWNVSHDTTVWRFKLHNGNWDPSSDNRFWFYLLANTSQLSSNNVSGYAVGVNYNNSSDLLCLYKISNGIVAQTMVTSGLDWNSNMCAAIEVMRTPLGQWFLRSDTSGTFNYLKEEGNAQDSTFTNTDYCGLVYNFTSSRKGLLWMDDLYIGMPIREKEAPFVKSTEAISSRKVSVLFSENVDSLTACNTSNYILNNAYTPYLISFWGSSHNSIELTFSQPFSDSVSNSLIISNVCDMSHNKMQNDTVNFIYLYIRIVSAKLISANQIDVLFSVAPDSLAAIDTANYWLASTNSYPAIVLFDNNNPLLLHLSFGQSFTEKLKDTLFIENVNDQHGDIMDSYAYSFVYYQPQMFDVLITEIMCDPEPSVALPETEYIELYNRCDVPINLLNWKLAAGTSTFILPEKIINPSEYLILTTKSDIDEMKNYGNSLAIFSSASTLNNDGEPLQLFDSLEKIISWANYSPDWYADEYKSNGGWSLEMIDPHNPCGESTNWKASIAKTGGTPGEINSVFATNSDTVKPSLLRAALLNDTVLLAFFSEPLDSISSTRIDNYSISPTISIKSTGFYSTNRNILMLNLNEMPAENMNYILTLTDTICDCVGNNIADPQQTCFAIAENADSSDVVINEVLFNAKSENTEFVELYNRSNKVIDLRNYLFCRCDETSGIVTDCSNTSNEPFLLFPGHYVVLSTNEFSIRNNYYVPDSAQFSINTNMPVLPDDAGTIAFSTKSLNIISRFSYNDNMHFSLLSSNDGVSLECINNNQNIEDAANWHSAAENAGYATPGYRNSQYLATVASTAMFNVSPEVFSPDNDGYNDVLSISYGFEQASNKTSVLVYNASGQCVKHLISNETLSTEGILHWDGTNDKGEYLDIGIYVIYIESVNSNGKVSHEKKTCVLARKMK